MPSLSKTAYDLVTDDGYDSRIPLHNEEAFEHGITFQAKYIGTLDIPRPSTRVEIVAAMRRIRYEFKAKAIKKKKISMLISVDGVKIVLRKNKRKKLWNWDESRLLMQHPIYRIFYVSHDSQDLKIWSYIAREAPSNVFKCNVFKAYKKSQATRIVRTLGQAFEVCNKLSLSATPSSDHRGDNSDQSSEDQGPLVSKNGERAMKEERDTGPSDVSDRTDKHSPPTRSTSNPIPLHMVESTAASSPLGSPMVVGKGEEEEADESRACPLSARHQMQLLRQQLTHQQHQTQAAIAQVHLLKDHLSAETAARIEAQARTHQLMLHNKDLLEHVGQLVSSLQAMEMKGSGTTDYVTSLSKTPPVPQLPDLATSSFTQVFPLDVDHRGDNPYLRALRDDNATFENSRAAHFDVQSPDSGHREMSSDSLTGVVAGQSAFGQTQASASSDSNAKPGADPACKEMPPEVTTAVTTTDQTTLAPSTSSGCTVNTSSPPRSGGRGDVDRVCSSKPIKIITPLPPQNASGNRLDLTLEALVTSARTRLHSDVVSSRQTSCSDLPRIDPPPRVHRVSRKAQRTARGSWYGEGSAGASPTGGRESHAKGQIPKSVSDLDYYESSASSPCAGDRGTFRSPGDPVGPDSLGTSSSRKRCSDSSTPPSSQFPSSCHDNSSASLANVRDKLDHTGRDFNQNNEVPHDKDGQQVSTLWHNGDLQHNGLEKSPDLHHGNHLESDLHQVCGRKHSSVLDHSDSGQLRETPGKSNVPCGSIVQSNSNVEWEIHFGNNADQAKISGVCGNGDILTTSLSQ